MKLSARGLVGFGIFIHLSISTPPRNWDSQMLFVVIKALVTGCKRFQVKLPFAFDCWRFLSMPTVLKGCSRCLETAPQASLAIGYLCHSHSTSFCRFLNFVSFPVFFFRFCSALFRYCHSHYSAFFVFLIKNC